MHVDAGEKALAVSDHDREDHRLQPLHGRSQAGCLWSAALARLLPALARLLHAVRYRDFFWVSQPDATQSVNLVCSR